jgi:large subunit ribosomal protein L21
LQLPEGIVTIPFMFAVLEISGKQYKVAPGEKLTVAKIAGKVGDIIKIDKVLMLSDGKTVKVGTPTVANASAQVKITGFGRRDRKSVV